MESGFASQRSQSIVRARRIHALLVMAMLSITCCFAQKIQVGFDKSTDFSKFKSYTFHPPQTTGMPLLYMNVVSVIRTSVESKGLASKDNEGDLLLIASGGFAYGSKAGDGLASNPCPNCKAPLVDPLEWTGQMAPPGAAGVGLPKGVLALTFVDQATNKIVWAGTVSEKLDPSKKQKSLDKAVAAVQKLLDEFPPKK